MQSDLNTSTQRNAHTNPNDTSVDSSIAAFATETKHDAKGVWGTVTYHRTSSASSLLPRGTDIPHRFRVLENLSFNNDKPSSPDTSMHSSSVEDLDLSRKQQQAEAAEDLLPLANPSERISRANRVLDDLGRYRNSRIHHHSLLLDDLQELGMVGELSENNKFVTTSFEDIHRLVKTMKMAELILNDTVQSDRKEKIEQIRLQLGAEHCPNVKTLLSEMEKAKYDLIHRRG
jgi:hypothetical protein